MSKKESRLRRASKTRVKIRSYAKARLCVNRSNLHIYAQIFSPDGQSVLACASSAETEVRVDLKNGGNKLAAALVGRRIAEKARALGLVEVAFDRSGFKYHGRIKVLAEAARENGLVF